MKVLQITKSELSKNKNIIDGLTILFMVISILGVVFIDKKKDAKSVFIYTVLGAFLGRTIGILYTCIEHKVKE